VTALWLGFYEAQVRIRRAVPAQKLGRLQHFIAVSPEERVGQLASFGPT
jgi:hypothetical protein